MQEIQIVKQKYSSDCGIACIAMITGMNYEDVEETFVTDFTKDGVNPDIARQFIENRGFSCIQKLLQGYFSTQWANEELLKPFAPIHLIAALQSVDGEFGHAFVMDANGNLICPTKGKIEGTPRIYKIQAVYGFWKDSDCKGDI